jgi:hypothetical protein
LVVGIFEVGAAPPPPNIVRTEVKRDEDELVFFVDSELVWLSPLPVPVFPCVGKVPVYVALNDDARAR